jgi:hypothetical protein
MNPNLSQISNPSAEASDPVAGRCAVLTGSLAGMTNAEATDALWDALRLECCSTGLKAHRIIMLHKHDIAAALKRLTPENAKAQPRDERANP